MDDVHTYLFQIEMLKLPNLEMDADVGGDDWTNMSSKMKKLENRLIPEKETTRYHGNIDVCSYILVIR